MKNISGSEEPLSEYKSDVIKEIDVEDLHYMQDNRQIQLATEGASRERKRATRQYIPRAIMREKCTTRLGWDDRPITLGRLGSPLAFPFRIAKSRQSSRSVHGGSGEPMFGYNSDAIDKERTMETCMTCREKEQNRLATEGASRERKRATRQYIPRAIMREKCTDRPITLGRLGSPLAFPFRIAKSRQSSRSVHGGSWGPMFRYNLNAIDKERTMETCMTCREKEQNRLATEITSTERNSIGYADVQIKSARNGRRDSLIKSREQDIYNSASKVPKATPCGQSPMGTPNAQDIIL